MTKAIVGQKVECSNIKMMITKISKDVIILTNIKNKKTTSFKPEEFYRTYRFVNDVWIV